MRRILFIILTVFSLKAYCSNFVYIPDSIFRDYISSVAPGAIVGDSMDITDSVIENIDSINITGLGISSIEGIEYFDSLKDLYASNNLLSALPTLPAGVLHLDIDSNILYTLASFPAGLTQLYCNNCSLFQISALPPNLQILDCRNNKLLCLPGLPDTLVTLLAGQNYMTCIPNLPSAPGFTSDIGTAICGAGVCDRYDTISGYAYLDLNDNGVWDSGEPPLANVMITMSPLFTTTITDSNGFYSFEGNPGIVETLKPDSLPFATFAPDSINVLLVNPLADTGNLNFGYHFMSARVFATEVIRAIPGQVAAYSLAVNNNGVVTDTGTLLFIFDTALFTYISSSPAAVLAGDTLIWNFSNLLPATLMDYTINLSTKDSDIPGTPFADTAFVSYPVPDSSPGSSLATISDNIVSSYQRNNKTVSPTSYISANYRAGDYFDYTITFQNTDSQTVGHIWIIDTLSSYFNMSTLFVVAASAPYVLTVNGNALRVDFNNINLPDSAVSQLGSHGFFRFLIQLSPNITSLSGTINNTAYIYFDGKFDSVGTQTMVCLSSVTAYVTTTPEYFSACLPPTLGNAKAAAAGVSPFSYIWSSGATTYFADSLTYGQYYVTISDACTSTAVGIFTIDSVRNWITVLDDTFIPSCYDSSNGSASILSVCGFAPPFTYYWSNGDTTETVTNLAGYAFYYCTITDAQGDTLVETFDDNNPIQPFDDISVNCSSSGSSAAATVQVYDNYNPITVNWSNGDTGVSVYNLAGETYWITIQDGLGCTATDNVSINLMAWSYLSLSEQCDSDQIQAEVWGASTTTYTYGSSSITIPGGNVVFYAPGGDSVNIQVTGDYGFGTTCPIDTTLYAPLIIESGTISNYSSIPCVDSANYLSVTQIDTNGVPYSDYFTYQWSTGGGTGSIGYPVPAGIYSCTVTDYTFQCVFIITDTITGIDSISLQSDSVLSVSCYGGDNGSLDIVPISPTPLQGEFYYAWFYDDSYFSYDSSISGLTAGIYICQIGDDVGCFNNFYFTITQPDSLTLSSQVQNSFCAASPDGSIQVNGAGGTPGYSYSWSNGENGNPDTLLIAGPYSLTVTDTNNCTVQQSFNVSASISDSLTISPIAVQNPGCYGNSDGRIEVTASNGAANYTYAWNDGQQGTTDTALRAGFYACTVTDSLGCFVVFSDSLTQPAPLLINTLVDTIPCYGDSTTINIDASGGTAPYTGTGSFTEPAGTYGFTIVDSNGCTTNDTVYITQPNPLLITDSATNILCYAGAATVTVNANGGTQPFNGTGQFEKMAGSCGFTVIDANGCSATDSLTLIQPDSLTAVVTSQPSDCGRATGAAVVQSVSGGTSPYTLQWSNGDTTYAITNISSGTYDVTITDRNGCVYTYSDSVLCVTGIENIDNDKPLLVYPNPNSGSFVVEFTDNTARNIAITDMVGQIIVPVKKVAIKAAFDLSNLSAGVYLLKITDIQNINQMVFKEVVVEH